MALTPMMQQYFQIKEQYKDCILFYRLGDFYEMFFDDALLASKELEITLTGRDCGLAERAPMCGVPFHAADTYIARLVEKGYKVAICEQLQDPSQAKGIVERGIIRIVTPGTVSDNAMLGEKENNYILSICAGEGSAYGVAYADVSTGAFFAEEAEDKGSLTALMNRLGAKEAVCCEDDKELAGFLKLSGSILINRYPAWAFEAETAAKILKEHFAVAGLSVFGLAEDNKALVGACGALMQYLTETQKNTLGHISSLKVVSSSSYMTIDKFTHRNLELTETMRDKSKKGSLLWLLDKTKTAMGGRLIKTYIERPLLNKREITDRLNAVDELKSNYVLRSALRQALGNVYDIERLLTKISYQTLDGRHALSILQSLEQFPEIKELLEGCKSGLLKRLGNQLDPLEGLKKLLSSAIIENPPIGITDGGIIKEGFHHEVDRLRTAANDGATWLKALEERERESTGIKNLKVGYNKVFGYYIEVTKSNLGQVPYHYTRRQTLAGCERFITKELKDLEDTILSAKDRLAKLEYELFCTIRAKISDHIAALQKDAEAIAAVDVLQSFAQAAYDYNYVKPKIKDDGIIEIKNGRHPVVERTVNQEFVPNDAYLDQEKNCLLVITGPNMAGKSTFMRQVGLIILMAHMGSFVPATSAEICLVDRVFTRVGASDDLSSGQSTFMVEMNELASILNNATEKSVLILDEIGRGTSTTDGLSIAWATIEYILENLRAKTLFATHYHELTSLEGTLDGLQNYSISIRELQDTVIFLHKIKRGGADRSFGIEVAKLAGLPAKLLDRSKVLLKAIEESSGVSLDQIEIKEQPASQAREADYSRVIGQLRSIDINTLTPLESMAILAELAEKVRT